jgi:hypothetical protein
MSSSAIVHVASPSEASPYRTDGVALCGATALGLALVDPQWAVRATCQECLAECLRVLGHPPADDPEP